MPGRECRAFNSAHPRPLACPEPFVPPRFARLARGFYVSASPSPLSLSLSLSLSLFHAVECRMKLVLSPLSDLVERDAYSVTGHVRV